MTTDGAHSTDFSAYLKELPVSDDKNIAEVVLLTCMDFRFFELVTDYMRRAGLTGKYYHLILAGAAAGAVVPKEPADPEWHKTFFDHLELAISLDPQIQRVIILEHRGCKAYEKFGLLVPPYTDEEERKAHDEQVGLLRGIISSRYRLHVESFLLTLEKTAAADEETLTFEQMA
ncbi:MAG TPA: hypothetical protein VJ715_05830 [Pyrinomonadaceae bacterium]|nr:hypothetical protein [Pyrinomonadaceae bacterium]